MEQHQAPSRYLAPLFGACVLVLAACGFSDARSTAEGVGAQYLALLERGAFGESTSLLGDEFWEHGSKEKYFEWMYGTKAQLGLLEDYEVTTWSLERAIGQGDLVELIYGAKFETHDGSIELRVLVPQDGSAARIVGLSIHSDGFLE